ncbi:hypothetical protein EV138_1098 [Kribbella voronezhensis]|uniref:Uncharacterized protein n=1 Tax=Kribbella voronezhensis TaxID=2512212 RepID=A0A4R7T6T3_9ACTN|nr:hypothetical protein [Kribbella voronezhensis]TDU87574.1 hypothetical protein EV138_1098 [Kribbella voronezhensis]
MAPVTAEDAEIWMSRTALDFLDQSVASEVARRAQLLDDEDVQGLWWLSQYLHVWILKGPGLAYCSRPAVGHYPHPYEFCLDVLARAIHYNGGRECISRFPSMWHDCGLHQRTAPPFITKPEFEQILLAGQDERSRLHSEYIASQQLDS